VRNDEFIIVRGNGYPFFRLQVSKPDFELTMSSTGQENYKRTPPLGLPAQKTKFKQKRKTPRNYRKITTSKS
jgi:hypothetical protein